MLICWQHIEILSKQCTLFNNIFIQNCIMAYCGNCGTLLTAGAKFCPNCGCPTDSFDNNVSSKSIPRCPHCGTEILEGDVYCWKCGGSILTNSQTEQIVKEEQIAAIDKKAIQEKKRGSTQFLSYIIIPLLLAVLFIFIFFAFSKTSLTFDPIALQPEEAIKEETLTSKPTTKAMAVDLGLPSGTKWADRNVGATKPEDYGGYYAWGETEEKEVYNWSTYIHCDGSSSTCHDIGSDISGTQYDVAHVIWGGAWKMPTSEQVQELLDECTIEWKTVNRVNGRKFTGPNGNSIFLPAAGDRWDGKLGYAGSNGNYWSSTLNESYPNLAYYLYFASGGANWYDYYRYRGFTVRPVR